MPLHEPLDGAEKRASGTPEGTRLSSWLVAAASPRGEPPARFAHFAARAAARKVRFRGIFSPAQRACKAPLWC
jgi:hypothetical protein